LNPTVKFGCVVKIKKPSRAQNLLLEDTPLTNHFTDTAVLAPYVDKTNLIFVSDKNIYFLILLFVYRRID